MHRAIAAALIFLLPAVAEAQDRPLDFPTRDVTVTYRMMPEIRVTVQWASQLLMARETISHESSYMVFDFRNRRAFGVMEPQRMIMEMTRFRPGPLVSPWDMENVRFTRGGIERIAGHDCAVWHFEVSGNPDNICATADGVVLRAGTLLEAVSVNYGALDPALFHRPQGYRIEGAPPGRWPG
jgi:hypothetical protein